MTSSSVRARAPISNPLLRSTYRLGRSRGLMLCIMVGFVLVAVKSLWLQHVNVSDWQKKAEKMYEKVRELPATRGRIVDRTGAVLASSVPVVTLGIVPKKFDNSPRRVEGLAQIVGMTPEQLKQKIESAPGFFYLAKDLPIESREKIIALSLSGVELDVDYRRAYPYHETFAHVVGFIDNEDNGIEGLEKAYQRSLKGVEGSRRVVQDSRQNPVEEKQVAMPQAGKDLVLSLDAGIQSAAYSAVKAAFIEHRAKGASAVVLAADTGEILALVNMPTFDPSNRVRLNADTVRNRALTDTFEPGSTMKPFTIATALQRGVVQASTPIDTAPGKWTIGTSTIGDAHTYGMLSVAQVLQKSSNVGTAKISLKMAPEVMWQTYHEIGLGQVPQLGLQGATAGRLRAAKNWKPIEQATMSYGHGLSLSLVQLARAYTVFGSDGRVMPVSFEKQQGPIAVGEPVFSQNVVTSVRQMLEAAAAPGGTAPKAQIAGYRVGGKTGTAHKPERGGYSSSKFVASFVGLVPIDNPKLIIAVMVDEPTAGKHFGGEVAAPVFAQIAADAMRVMNIAPDPLVVPKPGVAVQEESR